VIRALCLGLLATGWLWAETLSIGKIPYSGRYLSGTKVIYAPLREFAKDLDVDVVRSGFGYWAGFEKPEQLAEIPLGKVVVNRATIHLLMDPTSREFYVPVQPFVQALGGTANWKGEELALIRPLRPKPRPAPVVIDEKQPELPIYQPPPDPTDFFITQYKSAENPDALAGTNSNCGPTTLAMVSLAYRSLPPGIRSNNRQGLILWCREQMTGNSLDQQHGVTLTQFAKAASSLGLAYKYVKDLDELDWELGKGHLVAVSGDMKKIGFLPSLPGPAGHLMLAVTRRDGKYAINDPGGFFRDAGDPMSREQMQKFWWAGLAIWKEQQKP
jgi:hypothetical protein